MKMYALPTSEPWTTNIRLTSLTPVSSYVCLHSICTLVLYVCMYVHVPMTVLNHR